ncbi:hypothetical protein, partial [Halapricum sp. CBA1109]|uniref:hypothetical protein n=1 Tax=Halapricum sp. CBA1109 TaxID=2668068 RepID=UPI001E28AF6F
TGMIRPLHSISADVDGPDGAQAHRETVDHLLTLLQSDPDIVAHDEHPEYVTTAERRAGGPSERWASSTTTLTRRRFWPNTASTGGSSLRSTGRGTVPTGTV